MTKLLIGVIAVLAALALALWVALGIVIDQRDMERMNAAAAGKWEVSTFDLQRRLAQCQGQWADARDNTAAALELALMAKEDADRELKALDTRWRNKTPTCEAALNAMQAACEDEIGDY